MLLLLLFFSLIFNVLRHTMFICWYLFFIIYILLCTFNFHFQPEVISSVFCKKISHLFLKNYFLSFSSLLFSFPSPLRHMGMFTHLHLPSISWTAVIFYVFISYTTVWGSSSVISFHLLISVVTFNNSIFHFQGSQLLLMLILPVIVCMLCMWLLSF